MATSLHKEMPLAEAHGPFRKIFANASERTGDTGPYTSTDVDIKIRALQEDTMAEYVLTNNSPITWTAVSVAGAPAAHASTHGDGQSDELPHQNLAGAGTNTHAQIDTHLGSTSNPHSVAHSQLGGVGANDHHPQAHTVASHSDTDATGAQLNELTDASTTALHKHAIGSDPQYEESTPRSTTTSTSWQDKVTLTTPSGLNGTYRIGWSAVFDMSSTGGDAYVRCINETDSNLIGGECRQEVSDTDETVHVGSFEWVAFTGTAKTFKIQYRRGTASVLTVGIQSARIEFDRKF